jgi:hypothetical protein
MPNESVSTALSRRWLLSGALLVVVGLLAAYRSLRTGCVRSLGTGWSCGRGGDGRSSRSRGRRSTGGCGNTRA